MTSHACSFPCCRRCGTGARTQAPEEEVQGLWTPDWDDEDNKEDFLGKLKSELGADKMKD